MWSFWRRRVARCGHIELPSTATCRAEPGADVHACNLRTQEAEAGGLNSKQMQKQKQTFAVEIWKRVKGRCGLGVTDEPARSKPHAAGQALSSTCSLAILLPASTLTTHKPNLGEPLGGAHSEEQVQHLVHLSSIPPCLHSSP